MSEGLSKPAVPALGTLRLFVAIPVPEAVKRALADKQEEFQQSLGRDCVRWTAREQFHLTLRFLGNVKGEQTESLNAVLQKVCHSCLPFTARARGFGFFPEQGFPRVLWIGVESDQDQLLSLQRAVEAAIDPFTQERKEKSFSGHLTLGRSKDLRPRDIARLRRSAEKKEDEILGEWQVRAVELIQSELGSGGARHKVLARFLLGQGALAQQAARSGVGRSGAERLELPIRTSGQGPKF